MRVRLDDLLFGAAARSPRAPALTAGEARLSYGELAALVDRLAGGLRSIGVDRGDRVAVFLEKRIETVAAILAASRAGAVSVPVNPVLRAPQVGHIVADSGARVLVTSADRHAALGVALADAAGPLDVVLVDGVAGGVVHAWDKLADCAPWSSTVAIDSDIAAILYTSGSTGRPKGVVLSHRNLIVGAESVSTYLRNTQEDVILAALPLSFDAGLSQVTTALAAGAHVVLLNYLLPRDVVRACARHGVTGLTCVPPLWIQLAAQEWPPEATRSLRYFANTGGRMPRATLERLRAVFPGAAPFLMYGLTEAFRSTYLDPAEVDRRPDSIGKAIPNAEVLVVRDDGTPCDVGEEGELVHCGPLVALGYWNDPERTAERFRTVPGSDPRRPRSELAVFSGDRVVRDEDGFLYFVGRRDDMIKTSGYRVSPTEIEEAVYGTGLVRDAVALGIDDDALGQRIVLVASPIDDRAVAAEDVIGALRGVLPGFMVPKLVELRGELPRSPNDKFDRVRLREELASR
jgi:acyl-CoA ligase (AMP-forming) (exosortase A-associated)